VAQITSPSDPQVTALAHAIDTTIGSIFGPETIEYDKLKQPFSGITFVGPLYIGPGGIHSGPSIQEIQQRIVHEQQEALALLRSQVALMKEELGDEGGKPADRAVRAYSNLDLHTEIARAANDLYRDGHYANAIVDAVKALNGLVRMRSGVELDGAALMQKVFSQNAPVLRFNELKDQSDHDEQLGFMMLFTGAVAGLRNPRAHKLIKDDPERALEFIAFVSLLAKLVDEAKKAP